MQDHWLENGPPAYITLAAVNEFKPQKRDGEEPDITNPQDLLAAMGALPGGTIINE